MKLKLCFQHKGCLTADQVLFVVIVKGESTPGTREGFAAFQIVYHLFSFHTGSFLIDKGPQVMFIGV